VPSRSLLVLSLIFAVSLTSIACIDAPLKLAVISPEQGQLIRDAGAFVVEIHVDENFFDAGSLEAEINGNPLTIAATNEAYSATLNQGVPLDASNQLVVTAKTLHDGTPREVTVEFSWEPLPQGLKFSEAFAKDPPPVETADVEILHTESRRQNAILRVTFKEGFNAPMQIPFRVDAQTVFILDDSGSGDDAIANDGEYTARIDFDYENYRVRKWKESIISVFSADEATSLEFSGREIVSKKVPPVVPAVSVGSSLPTISLTLSSAVTPVVDSERALMIRDLSVVADPVRTFDPCDTDGDGLNGDPNGAWSFKTLMGEMANTAGTGISLDVFVRQWLAGWAQNFDALHGGSASGDWIVNNDVVPEREAGLLSSIVNPWPKTSIGTLDMDQAPFRLLSIVNRVDLREAVGYGAGSSSAGELRFVFGLLNMNSCSPDRMTAIFEYTVHVRHCTDVISYAQQWEDLDTMHSPFPASPGYLAHLQSITDPVTTAGSAPLEPNGSSIGQLRTSEVTMGFPWELREFTLQQMPFGAPVQNVLRMDTTKQTPDRQYTADPALQPILEDYIIANVADICDDKHVVPNTWLGNPFMAGRADFFPDTHFWTPGIPAHPPGGCTNDDIRFKFSSTTCSGCHGADIIDPAVDTHFYHVNPVTPAGSPVELSRFLTGTAATPPNSAIPDPSFIGGLARDFADLDRRGADLQDLLATGCVKLAVASLSALPTPH
jgi:hypothetical protein